MSDILDKATPANRQTAQPPTPSNSLLLQGLSSHLIVNICTCDDKGVIDAASPTVQGLFVEGEKSIESQWQSPFEGLNLDQSKPTLMAGLQSGTIDDTMQSVIAGLDNPLVKEGEAALSGLKGRSNFTKVNSTQIFLSTQSMRLSVSLFFMAVKDAKVEVENQIMLLEQWALPKYLYDKTLIGNLADSQNAGKNNLLFPSEIPPFVSVTLHGKTYKPFIIESVSAPLKAPIDKNGNRLSLTVSLNLISRQAWDAGDIQKLYTT